MQATIGANPKTSHDTNTLHEFKMDDDDDEIQVVEVTVRVYRHSLTLIVYSYIRVEL